MKLPLIALSMLLGGLQDEKPWRIVYEQDKKLGSMRDDGSDRREEPGTPPGRDVPSPDGKRILYIEDNEKSEQIWVCDADRKNPRKLIDNHEVYGSPGWTHDGRHIVFGSTRDGKCQVWIMESDGANAVRLTDHPEGARAPRPSPKGDLVAYLELLPSREEKLPESTLRTVDFKGGESKVVLEKTQILGYAWSPTGDRLACSLVNELRILEMPSGKALRSFTLSEISKQLHAHAAFGIVWRPDGKAIACTITFLGGRMLGTKVYGDDQMFVLPFEGKPVTLEMKRPAGPLRWTR
ncbi:MAG TPA: hypothetical protein VFC86_11610 [Planctomycetota bacterium]|nr:hypothetical protein [Planctomycetota bacterium]